MTVQDLLNKIKPEFDAWRAKADAVDAAVDKLDSSLLGELVQKFPVVGADIQLVVEGLNLATAVINALDNVVDTASAPTPAPK